MVAVFLYRRRFFIFLAILILSVFSSSAGAKIIYVKSDAAGSVRDGSSWGSAFWDVQSALDAAKLGDTVFVAAGTYTPVEENGGTGDRFASFQLKNGVGLYGGFAGTETDKEQRDLQANSTILSGDIGTPLERADNCYHVFYHPQESNLDASAVLDGFIIIGGYANGSGDHRRGGGMYNEDASPAVSNCSFKDNHATQSNYAYGGGMYNLNSSPQITCCTFMDNTSQRYGGGIYNSASSPVISDCLFKNNRSGLPMDQQSSYGNGGGMYTSGTSFPVLIQCTFDGNTARYDGGGMYNTGSGTSPTLINCKFLNNTSEKQHGGAMFNAYRTSPEMANCIFSHNQAMATARHGGAIYNHSSSPILTNCVFYHNEAGCVGDTIYNVQFSHPVIGNSILWSHEGDSYPDLIYNTSDSSPVVTYCNIQGGYGDMPENHNMDQDPLFIDPENHDFHLQAASPCIDAGSNDLLPLDTEDIDADGDITEIIPCDMDKNDRRMDEIEVVDTGQGIPPVVDMGIYESGQAESLPGDLNGDGQVDRFDIPDFADVFGLSEFSTECAADFETDKDVDGADLSSFIGFVDGGE